MQISSAYYFIFSLANRDWSAIKIWYRSIWNGHTKFPINDNKSARNISCVSLFIYYLGQNHQADLLGDKRSWETIIRKMEEARRACPKKYGPINFPSKGIRTRNRILGKLPATSICRYTRKAGEWVDRVKTVDGDKSRGLHRTQGTTSGKATDDIMTELGSHTRN